MAPGAELFCFGNISTLELETWRLFKSQNQLFLMTIIEIYLFTVLQVLVIIVGVTGNGLLLLLAIQRRRQGIRPFDLFVGGMALANICLLGFGKSLEAAEIYWNTQWFWDELVCKVMKYNLYCFHVFSVTCQLFVSIDRYLKLLGSTQSKWPKIDMKVAKQMLVVTTVILLFAFVVVPTHSRLILSPVGQCDVHVCIYFDVNNSDELIVLILGIFFILILPSTVVLVVHVLIFVWLIRYRKQQRQTANKSGIGTKEYNAIKIILLSGGIFVGCWFMSIVIFAVDQIALLPISVSMFGRFLGMVYTAIIPFIFGYGYKPFQKIRPLDVTKGTTMITVNRT